MLICPGALTHDRSEGYNRAAANASAAHLTLAMPAAIDQRLSTNATRPALP